MNLHEYQAKALFKTYHIPTPEGHVAFDVEQAVSAAQQLGGSAWLVKAQAHTGGRGKAGGVKIVDSLDAVRQASDDLLGSRLFTQQSGEDGQAVSGVLIETPAQIEREFYLSLLIDRSQRRVVVVCSSEGGMDIETVAAETPDKIWQHTIHPISGIQANQAQALGFALQLDKTQRQQFSKILQQLLCLFMEQDLSLLEINPLVLTQSGDLLAVDAKIQVDDNALFRHADLLAYHDVTQIDEREDRARQHELNYIALSGDIGCMVNGAGLAMATMDLIKLHGGQPANFLDVGGGATAERVTEAFKLILSDSKVKAVLVNIFGGIVRCDLIAEGIIQAAQQIHINVPIVVRLQGTAVEAGRALLEASDLNLLTADDLTEAAQKVVNVAAQAAQQG